MVDYSFCCVYSPMSCEVLKNCLVLGVGVQSSDLDDLILLSLLPDDGGANTFLHNIAFICCRGTWQCQPWDVV